MKGSLLFEQDQNWDVALKNFKSARYVDSASTIHPYCLEEKINRYSLVNKIKKNGTILYLLEGDNFVNDLIFYAFFQQTPV